MASDLETTLKTLIHDHPEARLHPYSPSGPYVRAVMWAAEPDLIGQAFWEPENHQWVVRAVYGPSGEDSQVQDHPADMGGVAESISRLIADLRRRYP